MATRKSAAAKSAPTAPAGDSAPVSDAARRLVAALGASDGAMRDRAAALIVDTLLDSRVDAWIDADELVDVLAEAVTAENVARVVERHAAPSRDRLVAHWEASGERPRDFLTPELRRRVEAIAEKAPPPRAAWAKDAVDPALVRQLIAPVLQETLLSFARRLPLPGVGESPGSGGARGGGGSMLGGIAGRLKAEVSRHAETVAERGKALLGGLGAQLEAQLQSAARDFSQTASNEMRAALEARLRSPEGRDLARRIRMQALGALLDAPLRELWRDAESMPLDEIDALTGPIAEHNRLRTEVRGFVRDEVKATLEVEGARSIREVLDEAGLLPRLRSIAEARAGTQLEALLARDDFARLVDDALGAAGLR